MPFTVQYSVCPAADTAISDWPEYTKRVDAESAKDAKARFNKWANGSGDRGTWMVLDVWEEKA